MSCPSPYDDIPDSYSPLDVEAGEPHVQTQSELLREALTQTSNKLSCSKIEISRCCENSNIGMVFRLSYGYLPVQ